MRGETVRLRALVKGTRSGPYKIGLTQDFFKSGNPAELEERRDHVDQNHPTEHKYLQRIEILAMVTALYT